MSENISPENLDQEKLTENDVDLKYYESIKAGDTDSFSVLFKKYYEPLYQFAGRYIKDAQTAENIVQNVFVKIWTNRDSLTIKSNVKLYLYTAVRNQALNYINQESKVVTLEGVSDYVDIHTTTPEEEYIDEEMKTAVHEAIDKLPEQCRHIYMMKRYDDLSYNEIAEIKGISVNTVKTQMKRALKSLHKYLAHLLTAII